MPTNRRAAADDPTRPNVYRLEALAVREILADDSTDPEEVAHREWLKRQMAEKTRFIASIPREAANLDRPRARSCTTPLIHSRFPTKEPREWHMTRR
jgi:hypothetical protein